MNQIQLPEHSPGEREWIKRDLERVRVIKENARANVEKWVGAFEAAQKAEDGLAALLGMEPTGGQELAAPPIAPARPVDGNSHLGTLRPRGEDAVVRLLAETGKRMKMGEIIDALIERDWLNTDAKHPTSAARTAIYRAHHRGTVKRDDETGRYYVEAAAGD